MVSIRVFCIFLVLYIVPCAIECDDNKTVLSIAVLLPLSSAELPGRPYIPAMDLALDLINNRTDILPNYHLQGIVSDSACSAGSSVKSFIDQIFNPPIKVGMVGPMCSTSTQAVAELASYWNLVLISAGATAPQLSSTEEYPTFLRTVSSDAAVVDGIIALMKHFEWSRVAAITQQEFVFTATFSVLSEAIIDNNLTETRNFQFETNSNPQGEVEKLYNSPFRVIFLNAYPTKGLEIICKAQELGMTLENGYVWLLYAWFGSTWWTGDISSHQYDYTNCSVDQRRAFLQGVLSIDHFPFLEEGNQKNMTDLGLSFSTYNSMYSERLVNRYSDIPEEEVSNTAPFTPLFVDAIWTLALALDESENFYESAGSLANFTYESSSLRERIFQNALKVQFNGLTGPVSYKGSGDRVGHVRYFQYRENSSTHEISSEVVAALSDSEFTYHSGESELTLFPNGVPVDKMVDYINPWLLVCCSILAIIGIVFAVCCLIFNLVFSQKKVIKLSSPFLNILIIAGAILFYIDVILLGLDKALVSHQAVNVLCMMTIWIAVIAFSLLFGTMFAKTWRVYYIFHASDQRKKTNKILVNDVFLFLLVGILVVIDLLFLIPITAFPSTRLQLVTQQLPSSGNGVPVEVCVCSASHRYTWLGVLFVYKGILLIIGVFLAFETRKVKIRQLNDSHLIAMCVYATVVLSIALAPIGLVLETSVDVFYAIIGFMVLFGTTLILLLLYVPKIYTLSQNPSGDVTTNSTFNHHGTTNMNGGIEAERRNMENLRQENERLRLELTKHRKMSVGGVSVTSLTPSCRTFTVSEVAKARRSVSDTLVSPLHSKYTNGGNHQPQPPATSQSLPVDDKITELDDLQD